MLPHARPHGRAHNNKHKQYKSNRGGNEDKRSFWYDDHVRYVSESQREERRLRRTVHESDIAQIHSSDAIEIKAKFGNRILCRIACKSGRKRNLYRRAWFSVALEGFDESPTAISAFNISSIISCVICSNASALLPLICVISAVQTCIFKTAGVQDARTTIGPWRHGNKRRPHRKRGAIA